MDKRAMLGFAILFGAATLVRGEVAASPEKPPEVLREHLERLEAWGRETLEEQERALSAAQEELETQLEWMKDWINGLLTDREDVAESTYDDAIQQFERMRDWVEERVAGLREKAEPPLPCTLRLEFKSEPGPGPVSISSATPRFRVSSSTVVESGPPRRNEPPDRPVEEFAFEVAGHVETLDTPGLYLISYTGHYRLLTHAGRPRGELGKEERVYDFEGSVRLKPGESKTLLQQEEVQLHLTVTEE